MKNTVVSRPSASVEERQVGLRTNYANRERLLLEADPVGSIGVPNIPLLAIRGWLCVRCLAQKLDLEACGACKRVRYCSERCQKAYWRNLHKKHCNAFRQINIEEDQNSADARPRSWGPFCDWLNIHMNRLAAIIDKTASSIFGSQPYCNTFYQSEYQLRVHQKKTLQCCKDCHVIFKCQECQGWNHSTQTCKFCQLLSSQKIYGVDVFNETGDAITKSPVREPSKTFTDMASLSGWIDSFKELQGKQEIEGFTDPSDFGFAPVPMARISDGIKNVTMSYWAGLRAATDSGSITMTIANALSIGLPDLRTMTSLLIHIVGAGSREYGLMMMFEEILRLSPNVGKIKTVLVGPNTPKNTGPSGCGESHNFVDHDCCSPCTRDGRKRSVALYRGFYHDFAKIEQYSKPDLAVLFHSGRTQSEVESWLPPIQFMVDQNIITACTTYTKREAVEEVIQLNQTMGARIIQRFEENKWT